MRIICWIDYNCPYCYIGYARLKKSIEKLNLDIKIEFKAFELDPELEDVETIPMVNYYARKEGMPEFEAVKELEEINELGKEEGLDYDYANAKITSSRKAHRLTKLAKSENNPQLLDNIIEKLFNAYLCENKVLSDDNVLIEIGSSLGLAPEKIKDMLNSDLYDIEVQIDEEDANINGISGVPHYILENKGEMLIIPGALTQEGFENALKDFISDEIESKTFI